jgi:hypothetical protein
MGAVGRDAINILDPVAHLGPSSAAIPAGLAALGMVNHHPVARLRLPWIDRAAHSDDDAARLVPADDRASQLQPETGILALRRPVKLQVAAAHPRSLHLEHDILRAWARIGEGLEIHLAAADENKTSHPASLPPRSSLLLSVGKIVSTRPADLGRANLA